MKAKTKPAPLEMSDEILMKFFKGLGDPSRLRIVEALLEKERNVSKLIQLLKLPQSNISNHLACLKWCGYISSRKEGTSVYYQVTDGRVKEITSRGAKTGGNGFNSLERRGLLCYGIVCIAP